MVREIEKSILYVVHNMHFTANQLAVCNIFYNSPESGIRLDDAAKGIGKTGQGEIGGILSQLAQVIDSLENPGEKFGFTGYILFFERFNGEWHKLRPELRHVIDQHPKLRAAMRIPVSRIYADYPEGIDLNA